MGMNGGVPVAEIYDPRLVFYVCLLIFIKRLPCQRHSNVIIICIMIFIIFSYLAY